jgi:hypothetical protein
MAMAECPKRDKAQGRIAKLKSYAHTAASCLWDFVTLGLYHSTPGRVHQTWSDPEDTKLQLDLRKAERVAKLELALSAMLRIYDAGDGHNDRVADAARKVLTDGA